MTYSLTIYNIVCDVELKPTQSISFIFLIATLKHLSCPFNSSSSPQVTFCPHFITSARENIKECNIIYALCFEKSLPYFSYE